MNWPFQQLCKTSSRRIAYLAIQLGVSAFALWGAWSWIAALSPHSGADESNAQVVGAHSSRERIYRDDRAQQCVAIDDAGRVQQTDVQLDSDPRKSYSAIWLQEAESDKEGLRFRGMSPVGAPPADPITRIVESAQSQTFASAPSPARGVQRAPGPVVRLTPALSKDVRSAKAPSGAMCVVPNDARVAKIRWPGSDVDTSATVSRRDPTPRVEEPVPPVVKKEIKQVAPPVIALKLPGEDVAAARAAAAAPKQKLPAELIVPEKAQVAAAPIEPTQRISVRGGVKTTPPPVVAARNTAAESSGSWNPEATPLKQTPVVTKPIEMKHAETELVIISPVAPKAAPMEVAAKTPVVDEPIETAPVAQPLISKAPIAQPPILEPAVIQPPIVQAPIAQPSIAKATVAQPPVAKATVAQAPVVKAPVAQAPVVKTPVAQPPALGPSVVTVSSPAVTPPAVVESVAPKLVVMDRDTPPPSVEPAPLQASPRAAPTVVAARRVAPAPQVKLVAQPQLPPPASAPYVSTSSEESRHLAVISKRAHEHVNYGFDLAERGALYSAEVEFSQALQLVAQGLDAHYGTQRHTKAVAAGLTALREADDFVPRPGQPPARLEEMISGHKTPVWEDAKTEDVPPLIAMQRYYAYAQQQFMVAAGRDPSAAMALYGMGRLQTALASEYGVKKMTAGPKAMALYQATVGVDPQNYLAANELGVMLARYGQLREAEVALRHSVQVAPRPENWRNLAEVYERMGDAQNAQDARAQLQLAMKSGTRPGRETTADRPPIKLVDNETFQKETTPLAADEMLTTEKADGKAGVSVTKTSGGKDSKASLGWIGDKVSEGMTRVVAPKPKPTQLR